MLHFNQAVRPITVAATQMTCTWDIDGNIANAERLVREAAARGAQIILRQECHAGRSGAAQHAARA